MKKIKYLILSIFMLLAFVFIGTSVKAAEVDLNVLYSVSQDLKTATWDATACNTAKCDAGNSFSNITVTGGTVTAKSTYLSIPASVTLGIPVPSGASGKISVYADSNNSSRGYTIEGDSTQYVSKKGTTPCQIPFTTSASSDQVLSITTYGGELKPTKIVVAIDSSSSAQFEATAAVYTVTYMY